MPVTILCWTSMVIVEVVMVKRNLGYIYNILFILYKTCLVNSFLKLYWIQQIGLDKEKEGEDAEGLTESVRYYLHAKHDLIAEDNVWLIGHSFTCDGSESTVHQLFGMNDKDNKLLERLCYLVNVDFPINLILKNKVFDQEMANTISTVEKEAGVSYARAKLAVKRQEG